ncbi:MAG TPA: CDGSH iron-sulfur domain-containing protein [Stenotrophobium sp.]|jgi:CDGSH-type Zn-finger protein|nr:CDGSH iron-sulfur domain-containing protein [Stenotrophobium sp.]
MTDREPHDLPESPQLKPYMRDLAPGDYWWCACGRSKNQPFCDGSHKGSRFTPVKFTVTDKTGTLWLCGCKRTGTPPFCDGTHNKLGR